MKKIHLLTSTCFALVITMPAIFADQMVLQRDQNVPVWGTSDASANIEVLFAGQKKYPQCWNGRTKRYWRSARHTPQKQD